MQTATLIPPAGQPSLPMHLARALRAVVGREIGRFLRQPSRLGSALVRPLLWFVVFSAWDPLESTCRHASLSIL